ncbi:MAG: hypothetical protein JST11_13875 [Acidobacteria bacterium]|nr:hypothetical protein [Acidobacteriota bacterium]
MKTFLAGSLLTFGLCCQLHAGSVLDPCVAGSVASYQALSGGGCTVGILVFTNFTFANAGNAANLDDATGITLTPIDGGFSFTQTGGGPLQVGANEYAIYDIGWNYFVDVGPVATGASMEMDPPFGNATATQYFCNQAILRQDGAVAAPQCYDRTQGYFNPVSLTVHNPSPLTAYVPFEPPSPYGDALTQILLTGDANGGAGFDALLGTQTVFDPTPEPGTVVFGLGGLVGLAALRRRRASARLG